MYIFRTYVKLIFSLADLDDQQNTQKYGQLFSFDLNQSVEEINTMQSYYGKKKIK